MFKPAWQAIWTAKEAEKEMFSFKFRGPGWYISGDNAMLVIPCETVQAVEDNTDLGDPWKRKWPNSTLFVFYVYDGWNPVSGFTLAAHAPTVAEYYGSQAEE